MSSHSEIQSVLSRAWADTKTATHKILFFWLVEVIAAGLGVFIGAILTPETATNAVAALNQAAGGILGVVVGFSLIFILNLVLAPYRLLSEARERIRKVEKVSGDNKQREIILEDIRVLIIDGTGVLQQFKAVNSHDSYMPKKEFKKWNEDVYKVLDNNKLDTESALFFKDTYIDDEHALLGDFIKSCIAGLDRLEQILKSL